MNCFEYPLRENKDYTANTDYYFIIFIRKLENVVTAGQSSFIFGQRTNIICNQIKTSVKTTTKTITL